MKRSVPCILFACIITTAMTALLSAQSSKKGENYAFLVACSGYDQTELKPLPYTVNDVEEFRKALRETGFADENIKMMHDKLAERRYHSEKEKILKELNLLIEGLKPEDTLVLALSGHGVHFKGDKTGYFCPVDATVTTKKNLIAMEGADGLFEILRKCPAKRKLLLVNACRNDPSSSVDLARRQVELDAVDDDVVPEGIAALYSCRATQQSYYDPDRKLGIFFDHVIRGWRGEYTKDNPTANLEDFFNAVSRKTKSDVDRTFGKPQTPEIRREYKGEWLLAVKSGIPRTGSDMGKGESPKVEATAKFITSKTFSDMKLLRIPAGSFTMGSPETEKDRSVGEVQHRVTLSKDFYMGEHTVTVGQWRKFQSDTGHDAKAGAKPDFAQGDDHPVVNVSHDDALAFCKWLSGKDGRRYGLPTESQWEYACRGGAKTAFNVGDELKSTDANFNGNLKGTSKVGSYKANAFGLYDMHGNVQQWCSDWFKYYLTGAVTDPTGPATGSSRVSRGGSWFEVAAGCRSANRLWFPPDYRYSLLGFRVAGSVGE